MQGLGETLTARRMEEEEKEKEQFSMGSELYLAFVIYALDGGPRTLPPTHMSQLQVVV